MMECDIINIDLSASTCHMMSCDDARVLTHDVDIMFTCECNRCAILSRALKIAVVIM